MAGKRKLNTTPLRGPNGTIFYNESQFKLSEGIVAYCHVHKVGFKTMTESQKHQYEVHDYRKVKITD